MRSPLNRAIWISRLVLGVAVLLFIRLGLEDIGRPVIVAARTQTTLGSPDAITVIRAQGGVFIGIAVILAYHLASERRLLAGLNIFAAIIIPVAGLRLFGLVLDGPGRFTLMTSKAEAAMAVIAMGATLFERRRSRSLALDKQSEITSLP